MSATAYFDHAATSWPKPDLVIEAVTSALTEYGGNPGRGAHRMAVEAARLVFESRESCADLLGIPDSRDLIFTPGCTFACNLMLMGTLRPGDRVVAGSMEHNAVARPLSLFAERGVDLVVVDADGTGRIDPFKVGEAVSAAPTRAVVCQHASNVTGAVQPIAEIAQLTHAAGALMLVDGAQAPGHLDVDVGALGVDAYAMSGHKGLLGPQGVGMLYLRPELEVEPIVVGGTGGLTSGSLEMPQQRPDRYEPGTPNVPGIAGLGAAVRLLQREGASYRQQETELVDLLLAGLGELPGYEVVGPPRGSRRVPVVSVLPQNAGAETVALHLDREYGIACRGGLHCSPWAHSTLDTSERGTIRFGIGWNNTSDQVELVLNALGELS